MTCPKCKTEYKCPCRSCVERNGLSAWVRHGDDTESCPCGFRQHLDAWLDEEGKQYDALKTASEKDTIK